MYDTPADARAQLAQQDFTRPQIEMIVGALVPTLTFRPEAGGAALRIGATRIGGTPDLPPGLAWPVRAAPPDAEAIAGRGNVEAAEGMRRHFRAALPYAFFAQVDLAEARGQGGPAADLPEDGRLLFFYDLIAGPWDTGSGAVRVIWDPSPRAALAAQAVPAPLAAAAAAHRAEIAQVNAAFKLPPPKPEAATPYGAPGRPMRLAARLRPPNPHSLEWAGSAKLRAAYAEEEADDFREAYDDLFAHAFDPHYGAANSGRRNQLLGSPLPEQGDPRYEAEVASRFGVQHLDAETRRARWPEIEAGARDWRLLLQIDIADFMQAREEGTVYVLIRAEDLAARRFDRAVAVYQQT